jgi:hypothetical protein
MFNAMKHKANILENQNVLMLFITFETNIINEDTQKYLQLHCSIELKKLWYRLVEGKLRPIVFVTNSQVRPKS